MVIKHMITKEKEGQYYTLPFDVPDGVVKITVSYDYYKPTSGMMGDIKPSNTMTSYLNTIDTNRTEDTRSSMIC